MLSHELEQLVRVPRGGDVVARALEQARKALTEQHVVVGQENLSRRRDIRQRVSTECRSAMRSFRTYSASPRIRATSTHAKIERCPTTSRNELRGSSNPSA